MALQFISLSPRFDYHDGDDLCSADGRIPPEAESGPLRVERNVPPTGIVEERGHLRLGGGCLLFAET